jgi:hypothetical protein
MNRSAVSCPQAESADAKKIRTRTRFNGFYTPALQANLQARITIRRFVLSTAKPQKSIPTITKKVLAPPPTLCFTSNSTKAVIPK